MGWVANQWWKPLLYWECGLAVPCPGLLFLSPLSSSSGKITLAWVWRGKATLIVSVWNSKSSSNLPIFINVTFSVWLTFSFPKFSIWLGMGRNEVQDLEDSDAVALGWHTLWKCNTATLFRLLIIGLDHDYLQQNNMSGWHNQRLRETGANWHIKLLSIL